MKHHQRTQAPMGVLNTRHFARVGDHHVEVRASSHLLTGIHYYLIVDGDCVDEEQNFWKIPTQRKLEARLSIGGKQRHIVVAVRQRWLSSEFTLSVDGEPVPVKCRASCSDQNKNTR